MLNVFERLTDYQEVIGRTCLFFDKNNNNLMVFFKNLRCRIATN